MYLVYSFLVSPTLAGKPPAQQTQSGSGHILLASKGAELVLLIAEVANPCTKLQL